VKKKKSSAQVKSAAGSSWGGGWFMGHSQDGSAHSVSAIKRQVMRITECRVGFCPQVRFWQWPIRVHEEIRFHRGGRDCEDEQPCTDITLFCRWTLLCSVGEVVSLVVGFSMPQSVLTTVWGTAACDAVCSSRHVPMFQKNLVRYQYFADGGSRFLWNVNIRVPNCMNDLQLLILLISDGEYMLECTYSKPWQ